MVIKASLYRCLSEKTHQEVQREHFNDKGQIQMTNPFIYEEGFFCLLFMN